MPIMTSDGVKLYVKISGIGYPTIFIHGGPGAWSYNFEMVAGKHLENFLKIIYFDQRGCGRSEEPKNFDYSLNRVVKDIEEIRVKLKFDKINLICHSFGGILGLNYILNYEKNINKVVFLNASLNILESFENQILEGIKILNLENSEVYKDKSIDVIKRWGKISKILLQSEDYYKLQYENKQSFEKAQKIEKRLDKGKNFQNYVFKNDEYKQDFTLLSKKITKDILIIHGLEDNSVGKEHHKKFNFPNKIIIPIKGKHAVYQERTEEVVKHIKKFFIK